MSEGEPIEARLARMKLVGFDVDGVFTDGRFYLADDGGEIKAFHTQDGYGVRRLLEAGIAVAVISGRRSGAVERRMRELGVAHVRLGCHDKVEAFREILETLNATAGDSAFVGDDLPDLPLLQFAGVAIGVANAHPAVLEHCDWVTGKPGGFGAVREVCDAVIAARDATGA